MHTRDDVHCRLADGVASRCWSEVSGTIQHVSIEPVDPVERWKQREADRTRAEQVDPYSDRSGYLDPQLTSELLDDFEAAAKQGNITARDLARIELQTRTQLHVWEKNRQLQRALAMKADTTAGRLLFATWLLASATLLLVAATVVLAVRA
jgi:hypothetical protein